MNAKTERHQIEACATEVLQSAQALEVPVDLSKVAQFLDVTVHYDNLEDKVSGVLVIKDAERHAIVNAGHHTNRQRFSLAHEFGHLMLHHRDDSGDRLFVDTSMRVYQRVGSSTDGAYSQPDSQTTPGEEREANQFASALLMPEPLIRREAQDLDLGEETDIAYLARLFGVSDQAMAIRLQQLHVVNLALDQ